jgi:hypothetical protein
MDFNLVLGLVVIAVSLSFTTYLTFRSRKSIDTIADKDFTNVRQIMKELRDGR